MIVLNNYLRPTVEKILLTSLYIIVGWEIHTYRYKCIFKIQQCPRYIKERVPGANKNSYRYATFVYTVNAENIYKPRLNAFFNKNRIDY